MDHENIDLILENETLKNEFLIRNLDLDKKSLLLHFLH
jgi:hypothetical protein